MKLDNNWKVPDGFEAVKYYHNDQINGETVVGVVRLALERTRRGGLEFEVGEDRTDAPALPLAHYGELWHTGWDIPTRWAIDARGRCFIDNAHGGSLRLSKPYDLVAECEREEDRREMQKRLGLPVDRPEWEKAALAAGWKPPTED